MKDIKVTFHSSPLIDGETVLAYCEQYGETQELGELMAAAGLADPDAAVLVTCAFIFLAARSKDPDAIIHKAIQGIRLMQQAIKFDNE